MKHIKQFDSYKKINESEDLLDTMEYKQFIEACDQYDFNKAFEIAQDLGLFGGDLQDYIDARSKQMPSSGLIKAYEAYTKAAEAFKGLLIEDIEAAQNDYGHETSESKIDEAKADQIFTIEMESSGSMGTRPSRYYYQTGTLAELISAYGYTLEVGQSYEREKGNKKININPRNVNDLIKNLNNAVNNSAANGYAGKDYRILPEGQPQKK